MGLKLDRQWMEKLALQDQDSTMLVEVTQKWVAVFLEAKKGSTQQAWKILWINPVQDSTQLMWDRMLDLSLVLEVNKGIKD